jgi:hypothetical protein
MNKQKYVIGHSENIVIEQHIHLKHAWNLRKHNLYIKSQCNNFDFNESD